MKLIVSTLLFCSLSAQADYLVPALIGAATVAVIRTPYLNNRCNDEPCNTLSHIALGSGTGWYIKRKYGIGAALMSGAIIGIGKELADKRFDAKDALATMLGTLLVLQTDF